MGVRVPDRKLIVLSVYRSPSGDMDAFLGVLSRVFARVRVDADDIILAGDINFHFQDPRDAGALMLTGFLSEYGLTSNFSEATRFHNCLDTVFTNVAEVPRSRVVDVTFSDHKGVVTSICIPRERTSISTVREVRPITQRGLNIFYQLVREADLPGAVAERADVNDAARHFIAVLSDIGYQTFPKKQIRTSNSNALDICWFTPQLKTMRDHIRELSSLYHLTADACISHNLRHLRRDYRAAIVDAKRSANDRYIRDHRRSASSIWKVIRGNASGASMAHSSRDLTADEFNAFFLSASDGLLSRGDACDPLSLTPWTDAEVARGRYFSFRPASEVEMRAAVSKLKSSKALDYFGLNAIMVKKIINIIITPMTNLFNRCVAVGRFPDILKIACVTPVYKKGNIDSATNYRPISILPVIGKVFERLLGAQLMMYLEECQHLEDGQHGFRAGRSTSTAICALIGRVVDSFERQEYCEVSFLDLSKAFDCVSHEVLLRKLYMFNLLPSACALVSSYLSNRRQCVRYGSEVSGLGAITVGVPQGSVLGPLLFLLYINDFSRLLDHGDTLMYADDTTVFSAGASNDHAVRARAERMSVAKKWYGANSLMLNDSKTLHVMYTLRRNPDPRQCVKFLGIHVDTELTWRPHCEVLCRRLSSSAYALRRLSESVSRDVVRVAYFALFQSHLCYGLLAWGHAASCERVFSVQRRVVRVLDGIAYRDDCRQSFIGLRLLTLPCLYIFECIKYVLNNNDRLSYRYHNDVHNYNTRGSSNIRLDSLRLTRARNATNYYGIKLYNAMDVGVRSLPIKALLKLLKTYLLDKAFYRIDDFLQNPLRASAVA